MLVAWSGSLSASESATPAAERDRAWIDALAYTANAPTGLYLVPEPAQNEPIPSAA